MTMILRCCAAVIFGTALLSAQYSWRALPNAPVTTNKHDDVFFISEKLGWLVTRDGNIVKTTDGGESWNMKKSYPGFRLRCIGFADSLRGWAGKFLVNPNTEHAVVKTTDGGETWNDVVNIPSPVPSGMCALFTDFDPVIYGCGRYAGPPVFIKSTDGGSTWISKDLSASASMLIDIHFFSKDTGIIAGAYGTHAAILRTVDGGMTWNRIFLSTHNNEWCWKISFPSRSTGFVSLQTFEDSVFILKTSDGGVSWKEQFFLKAGGNYSPQGIGFITPSVGWIGAYPSFGTTRSEATYKTIDGGKNWAVDPSSKNINRFRWLNDTLGYAAGNTIYKYAKSVSAVMDPPVAPQAFVLEQNFPNPFNPSTTIRFTLVRKEFVSLTVFDPLGRRSAVLLQDDELQSGTYSIPFVANGLSSGVYWYRVTAGTAAVTRSMILLK